MARSRLFAMAEAETMSACSATSTRVKEEGAQGEGAPVGLELAQPQGSSGLAKTPQKERRNKPSRNLLVIEQSITQLLLATKQLLDILTSWSQQQATKAEVSDIYVRLGTEFRMVCRACTVVGIETSDLGDVPEALKKILETALSQDPSRQNLDVYMPEIREVIINLLNGLKKKQQTARRNEPYTVCTTKREEGAPADLSHHLNATSRARVPSAIKSLYKYFMVPGMTNLAGGLPFPGYFPFDTLESSTATPTRFVPKIAAEFHSLSPTAPSTPSSLFSLFSFGSKLAPSSDAGKSSTHFSIPKFSPHTAPEARVDVSTALQYTLANGMAPVAAFVKDFALNHLHGGRIPYTNPGPEILLTCGNTDGLGKAISLLGERGDNMLVEEFTYPNSIQTAAPHGIGIIPVGMDAEGIRAEGPGGLRDVLENWNCHRQGKRPHLMYTVTIGQNPTGGSLSLERRKAIYNLCERFDIIIIEDDPYWYLQYTESSHPDPKVPTREGKYPFLEAITPSFLTIDVSGRVIRLDTFSKTIAPGCRLGWITAQPAFIERILYITESSTMAPSGFSQAMVIQLLTMWGMDGWVEWLENLRGVYEQRMLVMCRALEKHAETIVTTSDGDEVVVEKVRMYEFEKPMGGMFVWVHVRVVEHPAYKEYTGVRGHTKLEMATQLWMYVAETQLTLPCPGWTFAANEGIRDEAGPEKFRFCFAAIEEEGIEEATERFGKGVEAFWGLSAGEIEAWGKQSEERRTRGEWVGSGVVGLGWAGGVMGAGC